MFLSLPESPPPLLPPYLNFPLPSVYDLELLKVPYLVDRKKEGVESALDKLSFPGLFVLTMDDSSAGLSLTIYKESGNSQYEIITVDKTYIISQMGFRISEGTKLAELIRGLGGYISLSFLDALQKEGLFDPELTFENFVEKNVNEIELFFKKFPFLLTLTQPVATTYQFCLSSVIKEFALVLCDFFFRERKATDLSFSTFAFYFSKDDFDDNFNLKRAPNSTLYKLQEHILGKKPSSDCVYFQPTRTSFSTFFSPYLVLPASDFIDSIKVQLDIVLAKSFYAFQTAPERHEEIRKLIEELKEINNPHLFIIFHDQKNSIYSLVYVKEGKLRTSAFRHFEDKWGILQNLGFPYLHPFIQELFLSSEEIHQFEAKYKNAIITTHKQCFAVVSSPTSFILEAKFYESQGVETSMIDVRYDPNTARYAIFFDVRPSVVPLKFILKEALFLDSHREVTDVREILENIQKYEKFERKEMSSAAILKACERNPIIPHNCPMELQTLVNRAFTLSQLGLSRMQEFLLLCDNVIKLQNTYSRHERKDKILFLLEFFKNHSYLDEDDGLKQAAQSFKYIADLVTSYWHLSKGEFALVNGAWQYLLDLLNSAPPQ